MFLAIVLFVGLPRTIDSSAVPKISAAKRTETSVQVPSSGNVLHGADEKYEKGIDFKEKSSVKKCHSAFVRVPSSRIIVCTSRYCCTRLCSNNKCTGEIKCWMSNCVKRKGSGTIYAWGERIVPPTILGKWSAEHQNIVTSRHFSRAIVKLITVAAKVNSVSLAVDWSSLRDESSLSVEQRCWLHRDWKRTKIHCNSL